MELKFLRTLLPFCTSILLVGCLDVQDRVLLRKDLQVEWSLNLTGHLREYTSYFEGWEFSASDSADRVRLEKHFPNPKDVHALDSTGILGPLRQKMSWYRDSVGNIHFRRSLFVERNLPGEDGDFADRMLGSLYRGHTCFFGVQLPGKIIHASPRPLMLDSMAGEARWEIPLAQFLDQPLEIELVSESLPQHAEQGSKVRFWFLVIAILIFISGHPVALWLRRK